MADIEGIVAAVAALGIAFGGYVQFVLRRSIYPCIEFEVVLTCLPPMASIVPQSDETAGTAEAAGFAGSGEQVVELVLLVHNVGPGVGFVDNLQRRVGFRRAGESGLGRDGLEPALVLLRPPGRGPRGEHWFLVAPMARGNFI
jgi:hypothetical protein